MIFFSIVLLLSVWAEVTSSKHAEPAAATSPTVRPRYSKAISLVDGDDPIGVIEIFDRDEPADVVHAFITKHSLPEDYRVKIMSNVCAAVECKRLAPVIWTKKVQIDGKWEALIEISANQEPADAIFASLKPYGVTFEGRQQLFREVKEANIPFSREHALIFSQIITLEGDQSFSQRLDVYDNGQEPVDALYEFVKMHSIEARFNDLANALLPKLCDQVVCKRDKPKVWESSINTEDGKELGVMSIMLGDEPIDAIDQFVMQRNLPNPIGFRNNLSEVVCRTLKCTRFIPVVYRKKINNEHGYPLGEVEILENQEVIDGTFQLLRKTGPISDELALKNYMLQDACKSPRVKCTRNIAVVLNQTFRREDGSLFNPLTIYENEEPADKVYQFCQDENSLDYYDGMIKAVCDSNEIICNRQEPVYFQIPISGPEGEFISTFQIKVNEEPVDA